MDNLHDELLGRVTSAVIELRHDLRIDNRVPTPSDEEHLVRDVARRFFDEKVTLATVNDAAPPTFDDETALTKRVIDTVLGCGPLQRLLDDIDITDIHVRGTGKAWVKRRDGRREAVEPMANSDDELIALIRTLASRSRNGERRFDASNAELNLCLDDGSRLFAVMDVSAHPSLVIRKHQFGLSSLDQLARTATLTQDMRRFLRAAVLARRNIVVVGGTGSGKTTLLRALINEIPPTERLVTIEDAYELGIDRFAELHPDFDALQTRSANVEGSGAIDLADLTRMALRMDPDRVVIGEVRGAEAFPMLLAMSQGNNGSMCTLHADSTRSAFSKLAAYVSMANTGLPIEVVNLLLANAVHLVVHVEVIDGRRRVMGVREVIDADGAHIVSNEIFAASDDGDARPQFPLTSELSRRLSTHGYGDTMVGAR
ncbi:MAG: CpaF family protein [Actinomycetota bacterium]